MCTDRFKDFLPLMLAHFYERLRKLAPTADGLGSDEDEMYRLHIARYRIYQHARASFNYTTYEQTYAYPQPITALATTRTKHGITMKDLIGTYAIFVGGRVLTQLSQSPALMERSTRCSVDCSTRGDPSTSLPLKTPRNCSFSMSPSCPTTRRGYCRTNMR